MESGNFGSEHEFGRFRTSNIWKVEILDLSTNLEDLGPVMHGKWKLYLSTNLEDLGPVMHGNE